MAAQPAAGARVGPLSSAALASASASSAVGASAVTLIRPGPGGLAGGRVEQVVARRAVRRRARGACRCRRWRRRRPEVQRVDRLAGERVADLDVDARRRRAGRRRSRPPSGLSSRFASRSAARPLPVPPVSSRSAGRAADAVVGERDAAPAARAGRAAAGARRGAAASACASGELGVAAGAVVAGGLELRDERRVDEAAGQLRGAAGRRRSAACSSAETGTSSRGSALRRQSSLSGRKRLSVASKCSRNARHSSAVVGERAGRSVPMQSKVRSDRS